jgi:hypothetical protein
MRDGLVAVTHARSVDRREVVLEGLCECGSDEKKAR